MKEATPIRRDTTHAILTILFVCLLTGLTFWILRPVLVPVM